MTNEAGESDGELSWIMARSNFLELHPDAQVWRSEVASPEETMLLVVYLSEH